MFYRFRCEAEFYPSLSRIPLYVRMKLDLTGLRISLKDWLAFDFAERVALCHLPCDSSEEQQAFVAYLDFLSQKYLGAPVARSEPLDGALWDEAKLPDVVREKSAAAHRTVTADQWLAWKLPERYALYKTAVSRSQPEDFLNVLDQLLDHNTGRPEAHGAT